MSIISFPKPSQHPMEDESVDVQVWKGRHRCTSNEAIIIPQAGAILAIRGSKPANKADGPSFLMIFRMSGIVCDAAFIEAGVEFITDACLLVLSTSKGEVTSAALIPLVAPHINAIHAPLCPRRWKKLFQLS